jgi:uncharacterized protein (DUF779 family)
MHCLCGLVVRVPGYISKGPRFDSRRHQIFLDVVGLERGPFSLESPTKKLLGRKNSAPCLESREYGLRIRYADRVAPSIRRQAAIARTV